MAMGLAGCGNSDTDENGDDKVNDIAKYEKDNSSHWIVGPDGAAGTKEKHTLVLDESRYRLIFVGNKQKRKSYNVSTTLSKETFYDYFTT